MVIPVSAKEKLGIDDLLEAILLVAEDIEPRQSRAPRLLEQFWKPEIEKGAVS